TLPPLTRAAVAVREAAQEQARAHLAPDEAALLLGMLLSERGRLPADLDDAFTRTGTVHILSVSGMHVAVIAALLLWCFRTLTVPRKTANLLCIPLVWLFALAASGGDATGSAPAFRAALCATVVLAAPLLRRDAEPLHSLAFAALVLLALDPQTLFDPGAQLSFATVATILVWLPLLEKGLFLREPGMARIARFSRGVLAALAVGVAAHAGSWPLAGFYFHQFSIVAPLANLPISLLADVLLVVGLLLCLLPALPLWWLVSQGLQLLCSLALAFAAPFWASVSVASPPLPLIAVYYLLLGGTASFARAMLAPRRLFAPTPPNPGDGGHRAAASAVPAALGEP
ncbi:MAG: ComEC/Rec2 family competence protein, partial [Cytophagales bacterium]|nr:ComEC/Rec2 family competence protein [Armatimonadota bacterium]